ncbi:ATP-dependent DNA helicase [Halobacillus yeomjeoni]|uniref:ATP-dependent DNA helicase n=1 Tax=Halobacillus yeomjeoni TaxID=311194 RepID=A0A931MVJ7_9BACI|nr:ATP-dependent DNA helicase [Halobacillus yeomjeoni]MBH0230446.1 ATP-dependent DNA helicase [Halobacillus yeomjeoni]
MNRQFSISVRELVSYVYRSGSIDDRFRSSTTLTEGTAIHQEVQKSYEENDQREVHLEKFFDKEDLTIHLQGRCDGILQSEQGPVIDEIKSTSRELEDLTEESDDVYWAQAKGYAFMYAAQESLSTIHVQLTYVQKRTKEKKKLKKTFSMDELEAFIEETLQEYLSYARILLHIREQKEKTIPDLSFPFPSFRDGQRKLAGSVFRTIEEKRDLFAQAPTGIGKTISTLFPAIKAMTTSNVDRIYYLTAKTVTRATAEEALLRMEDNGLALRSVTLTAKDKICFKEETICQPDYCEYADGYFDRINGAVVDILINERRMTREVIESYARKHRVCPFEYSLDLTNVVDVIVGDYNYIFDPRVSLKRLLPEQKKKTALLVDESHNLVERARDMYSAELDQKQFSDMIDALKESTEKVVKSADAVYNDLSRLGGNKGREFIIEELPGELEENLERFLSHAESYLQGEVEDERSEEMLDVYFSAQNFLKIYQYVDEHYKILGIHGSGGFSVKLFCLDPSHVLSETTKAFRSSIFFSATLSPFGYYKDMLGGKKEDYILQLPSPYDTDQIDLKIAPLSTRYKAREETASRLAQLLYEQWMSNPGNHLFFFPSYHYMELVYYHFKRYTDIEVVVQEQGMDELRREEFLQLFQPGGKLAGFAVLGGVFSEGVDLRGDRLNGVAVVGIGLAPRSFEKELIKDYFSQKGRNGYDYSYVYPGMNKVLQAGGRLIRSEEDRGTIQLIDDRFLSRKYLSLLPKDWGEYRIIK